MPIKINNLTVSYNQFPAVHHLDVTFGEGQSWAICGPNGAGKSTLLKAIMGLEKYDTGSVQLENISRREIAYLPQMAQTDRHQPINVTELVSGGLWHETGAFGGINRTQKERLQAALTRVGLDGFGKRQIAQLSNGQFQRVLFARMLVQNAKFLLLDEPFNAIDAQTTESLLEIIRDCIEQGLGVIAVLHNYAQVHSHFAHTLLMAREKIASGTSADVLTTENLHRAASFQSDILSSTAWCTTEENSQ